MAYTGTIKFITEPKTQAIVFQTLSGSTLEDGYRFVKADFSAKSVNQTINYTYSTDAGALSDEIIII
jgi:hypothetical protein